MNRGKNQERDCSLTQKHKNGKKTSRVISLEFSRKIMQRQKSWMVRTQAYGLRSSNRMGFAIAAGNGPAPNSGDCVPDGSGFETTNGQRPKTLSLMLGKQKDSCHRSPSDHTGYRPLQILLSQSRKNFHSPLKHRP